MDAHDRPDHPAVPPRRRLLVAALLTILISAGATGWLIWADRPGRSTAAGPGPGSGAGSGSGAGLLADPGRILAAWDRDRASAWAAGDVAGLRALYIPGSAAGRADVALLTAYLERGLTVAGMQRQVLGVEVRHRSATALRLVVTDRLASARAAGQQMEVALPGSAPRTRVVELRRGEGRWQVAEVLEAPR